MSGLLGGALSPEMLREVAGHEVRPPLELMHARQTQARGDRGMLLLVEGGAGKPFAAVKWGRGPGAVGLGVELAALQRMAASGDAVLARSCPAAWGPVLLNPNGVVTIQRCVPGLPVYSELRTSPLPWLLVGKHFARVERWLTRFWEVTGRPFLASPDHFAHARTFTEEDLRAHVEGPLRAARERLGEGVVPERELRGAVEASRAMLGQPVRIVARHGDLWTANILQGKRGLYVVDWEHFAPESLPWFDMLLFCTTYAMHFPWRPFGWAGHREAFARAFLKRTWMASQVRRFVARCCLSAGLDPAMLPVMLPVTLAQMALRRTESTLPGESTPSSSWADMLGMYLMRNA